MAAAVAQLRVEPSDSQLSGSTYCSAYCGSDDLGSDASSGTSNKRLMRRTLQSLYAKTSSDSVAISSSQTATAAGCFALQQQQYQPQQQLQFTNGAAPNTLDDNQRPTPACVAGGSAAPLARYLQLSCESPAAAHAALPTEGPSTPCARAIDAFAGVEHSPAEQGRRSASRRQLQQWLARHEAPAMAKSVAGAVHGSSSSSSVTSASEAKRPPRPALELAQALPPPAFVILGVLGRAPR